MTQLLSPESSDFLPRSLQAEVVVGQVKDFEVKDEECCMTRGFVLQLQLQ